MYSLYLETCKVHAYMCIFEYIYIYILELKLKANKKEDLISMQTS